MNSIELTIVVIVAIVVGGLTISNVVDAVKKVKLAKHGFKEYRDGQVSKL